ncbi:SNARE associated Golgi family protein [Stanieria cyanosphaera PCC 7437]|uniref:SNARE associated Golgi family protein n=1 Tax=Stanieria cyanosphaera (strain ATCC 29371 / PCC 7437) TaxID=111780 RepID=K9XTC9_STAC7|nr:DedA family protein [Stanieria cyanosphaera]AFZ35860.1 SNARE associated Golgi family protein [Stanieria cyanosphaera PCC 7437]
MSIELLSLDNVQEIARQYGYWAVFIGIALENTGIPLPGETITIVGGFLAGSGELNYWLVLASSISGAVLGDNFGYWIGKVGGWKFLLRVGSIFRIPEQQLELAKDKFSKNAAQAVFLGRFVTLLRIFAGPLAGIAQMPYQQFFIYNLAGAALWSSTIISLSFFLGKIVSLQQIVEWIAQAGIIALLIVVVLLVLSFLWEYRQKTLIPKD